MSILIIARPIALGCVPKMKPPVLFPGTPLQTPHSPLPTPTHPGHTVVSSLPAATQFCNGSPATKLLQAFEPLRLPEMAYSRRFSLRSLVPVWVSPSQHSHPIGKRNVALRDVIDNMHIDRDGSLNLQYRAIG